MMLHHLSKTRIISDLSFWGLRKLVNYGDVLSSRPESRITDQRSAFFYQKPTIEPHTDHQKTATYWACYEHDFWGSWGKIIISNFIIQHEWPLRVRGPCHITRQLEAILNGAVGTLQTPVSIRVSVFSICRLRLTLFPPPEICRIASNPWAAVGSRSGASMEADFCYREHNMGQILIASDASMTAWMSAGLPCQYVVEWAPVCKVSPLS
jgi:hypothetical protein